MSLEIRAEAEADIAEAFAWYESRRKGLGSRFLDELEQGLSAIECESSRFPNVHRNVRRALLRHFPYAIFFVVRTSGVHVLAVMHVAREPGRWTARS